MITKAILPKYIYSVCVENHDQKSYVKALLEKNRIDFDHIFVKPYLPKLIIIIIDDVKFVIKLLVLVLTGRIKNFTLLRDQE